ncbi:MAG: NADH dehydrogenase FAD-containing subunit [Chloroflexi bacterium]|nr:NADH dehydrogenase FAD-containing subunit [Chloroflexota bacterium]
MTLALWLMPVVAGIFALLPWRAAAARRLLLLVVAATHAGLTFTAWIWRPGPMFGGWIALDSPGLLFLTVTSALFLAAAVYGYGYLGRQAEHRRRADFHTGIPFANQPDALFVACLLFFLGFMSLVTLSQHLGLLWAAVEATTLSSAPLIYFHRQKRALEAAWKYLIISSVGIALALLGTMFVSVAASASGAGSSLAVGDLLARAGQLDTEWLKPAFILILVGYGTKMGLAPLHTWLPDAHSEAPTLVSALLSGALLNTAFLGILRVASICNGAGLGDFTSDLLIVFAVLSMGVAAVFVLRQPDYKRMLAYSSVEHMGILAFGVGIGGQATYGAMLHAVNHSMTKGLLFLVAGNILAVYRTKAAQAVTGLIHTLPASGLLWTAGFLAIIGTPPFGTFNSELMVLKGGLDQDRWVLSAIFLGLLATVFVGMASAALHMLQGRSAIPEGSPARESLLAIAPPAVLGGAVLLLGLYIPGHLDAVLRDSAAMFGVGG